MADLTESDHNSYNVEAIALPFFASNVCFVNRMTRANF